MISIAEFISGVSGLSAAHDNSIVTKFMSEVIRVRSPWWHPREKKD